MNMGQPKVLGERERTVSQEDLARLKLAREEADGRYNAALTDLDAAISRLQDLPHPPPAPDETQVTPLNSRWDILAARPALPAGWRGRLARFVWAMIEPALATQQAFNSALVDHINRNIAPQREIPKAVASTIGLVQQQVDQLIHFQSRLIVYLQQVTPYVDTKDYEFAGLAQRVAEDAQQELDQLARTARGLAGGLSGVSDEMLRRFESLLARDQRYTGQIDALRSSIAVAQQQVSALKREVAAGGRTHAAGDAPSAPIAPGAPGGPGDSWKYVGFEDLYRGSQDVIRARQEVYLPLFARAADVLDVGCGRGEFLDLLAARGVSARGLDLNHEMVEVCRARGLDVTESDALSYLRQLPDESLGGLIAAQVVEHLEPQYLLQCLDEFQRVLRPGSTMVLETINVACWLAFFESYLRDITHVRPLHPDTLTYLVTASGFVDVNVQFAAPTDPANRLQPVSRAARTAGDEALRSLADTFDGNVERLNRLMFTHLDYAVIAQRP
jgi:2-polyprenyl-3-methyl-5-hydroxy-6-metoxy-1,4-benzoquinol methylase